MLCSICDKSFSTGSNLRKHIKQYHPESVVEAKGKGRGNLRCPACPSEESFPFFTSLLNHVGTCHGVEVTSSRFQFSNEEDFALWLSNEEEKTSTKFKVYYTDKKKKTFICRRSGNCKPIETRRRAFKTKGSCKIGASCTAFITLRREEGGTLDVEYNSTHFGHNSDLNHLNLSKREKDLIASKLQDGVDTSHILDDLASGSNKDRRLDFVTRKDIWNIKKEYAISVPDTEMELQELDSSILETWCPNELNEGDDERVVFLHMPDEPRPSTDMFLNLSQEVEELRQLLSLERDYSEEILSGVISHVRSGIKLLQGELPTASCDNTISQPTETMKEPSNEQTVIEDRVFSVKKKKKKKPNGSLIMSLTARGKGSNLEREKSLDISYGNSDYEHHYCKNQLYINYPSWSML